MSHPVLWLGFVALAEWVRTAMFGGEAIPETAGTRIRGATVMRAPTGCRPLDPPRTPARSGALHPLTS